MSKDRLISLDVFRGLTILFMTIVNNPGSWSTVYPPLLHSEWHGCTPTDLVFPFFIFIMGVAISFAMPTKSYDNTTFNKIVTRSLRMICLGIFFNFFGKIQLFGLEGIPLVIGRLLITAIVGYALMGNFNAKLKTYLAVSIFIIYLILAYSGIKSYEIVRLPGVLQRIGIVYFIASLLYLKTNQRTQLLVAVGILFGYWALLTLVPAPGFEITNLEKGTNLAAWVDSVLLKGHMWEVTKTWDPEGILSTIPAIAEGIIGVLIGQLLNNAKLIRSQKATQMLIAGIILIVLGQIWNIIFPINKALWTSSYVLYTTGLATLTLSVLYYCIDIADYKKGTKLFLIWGVNPMIVFFLSEIIPQAMVMISFPNPKIATGQINLLDYLYVAGVQPFFSNPMNASLVFALLYVSIWSVMLAYFYKKKMYFKV
ncbi:acyltransferase family protein [Flavobacterium sp. WC2509]|uniref:acyltransferase family protein n=1 Tax=Flavobacterium sp. WC2509 TaxID=3461406 RepID=UPI0040444876